MIRKLLFPALAVGLGVGSFWASQLFFSQTTPSDVGQLPSGAKSTDASASGKIATPDKRESQQAPDAPRTIIRRHKVLPSLTAQETAAKDFPERTNSMRNMIGLSLSERRDELRQCVAQADLPFSTSTVTFHVDSSSESMTARMENVVALPDSLRQCIAKQIGTYEIAAEEGAPFLDGYSGNLDISLTINEPPGSAG